MSLVIYMFNSYLLCRFVIHIWLTKIYLDKSKLQCVCVHVC